MFAGDVAPTIHLAEVQLFSNSVQLSNTSLAFYLTSTQSPWYAASYCNDGILNNLCHSGMNDPVEAVTIVSPIVFNSVVVYNRVDGWQSRIVGATIVVTGPSGAVVYSSTFTSASSSYSFAMSEYDVLFPIHACSCSALN